ncbi:hypothetical protein LEMLEM_LOCUS1788, partial [Lemmus lemmus]
MYYFCSGLLTPSVWSFLVHTLLRHSQVYRSQR